MNTYACAAKWLIGHIHYHSFLFKKKTCLWFVFVFFYLFRIFHSFIRAVELQVFMVFYDSTVPFYAQLPIGRCANAAAWCKATALSPWLHPVN